MSQYLGRGSTSRGRMTITANLDTVVSTLPYLRDQHDVDAVIQGLVNLQNALKGVGLNWTYPAPTSPPKNLSTRYVASDYRSYANYKLTPTDGNHCEHQTRESLAG